MQQFWELTKRNTRLYFRDRSAVFFSLLSMLIIIVLMLLFLSDTNRDTITGLLGQLPGRDADEDEDNAGLLVLVWTVAGIIPINAVMVTLSALTSIIRDKTTGRMNAIYTAPVSRMTITLSYITAACISSVVICLLTLGISEAYLCIKGMDPFTVKTHFQILGMIFVNSFTYAAVMYLCAVIVRSEGAWSGVGTIVGTLVGFLGGIYMPVGQLADWLQDAVSCLPVIYGTVMFRGIMMQPMLEKTFDGAPEEMLTGYREAMGIDFTAFDRDISVMHCVYVVLGFGVVFMLTGALVTKYIEKRDR